MNFCLTSGPEADQQYANGEYEPVEQLIDDVETFLTEGLLVC